MIDDAHFYQTYGTTCVVLNEGSYTLQELKELVAALEKMNKVAHDSMQPIKETT
jgi:hypothetical protein